MRSHDKTIVITEELHRELQKVKLTRKQKDKALLLINNIQKIKMMKKLDVADYVTLAYNYFMVVFGDGRYNVWMGKLKKAGIIEVLCFPNVNGELVEWYGVGKAKAYRINPQLLSVNWMEVSLTPSVEAKFREVSINGIKYEEADITKDIASLHISNSALISKMHEIIDHISETDFEIGENIQDSYIAEVMLFNTSEMRNWSKQTCINFAAVTNQSFIKDRDRFFIAHLEEYIAHKKKSVLVNYTRTIFDLCTGKLYASRNDTNNRLDHNLTSLSKKLLQIILQDNGWVEIDLNNSQYAILAHLMKQDTSFSITPDFEIFYQAASTGVLYEYIASHTGKSREAAKAMLIKMTFSHPTAPSADKSVLKLLLPSVVTYCDNYKKSATMYQELAILLQKKEAEIFVDGIYDMTRKKGIACITKHDSILCSVNDADKVRAIMQEYFNLIGFQCTFKTGAAISESSTHQGSSLSESAVHQHFIEEHILTAAEIEEYFEFMQVFAFGDLYNNQILFKKKLEDKRKNERILAYYKTCLVLG